MKKLCFPITIFLLSSLISCSDERYYGPMRGWEHMGYYGHGGMLMWIIFIVIIGGVDIFCGSKDQTKRQFRVLKEGSPRYTEKALCGG